MGLDNIPKIYPCQKAGTAVMSSREDGSSFVDCDSTIDCGGCIYKIQTETDPLVKDTVAVYGMFGTPCWYRGKYGNSLLHLAKTNGFSPPLDFFGTGEQFSEDEGLDVDECITLSKWMADHTEKFAYIVETNGYDPRTLMDWVYASWWLKFVAKYAEGSSVWY